MAIFMDDGVVRLMVMAYASVRVRNEIWARCRV
jgi:hypothetical protein